MAASLTAIEAHALETRAGRDDTGNRSARKGFFTDTTLCIGCKACEVACKQWNQLPDDGFSFSGMSYDNTVELGASTWRHVSFIERPMALSNQDAGGFSWLFNSDVCKHCVRAGCLESCPTGAIVRTEFDSRLRAAGHLQWLRILRGELPVRRDRPQRRRWPRLEMYALL